MRPFQPQYEGTYREDSDRSGENPESSDKVAPRSARPLRAKAEELLFLRLSPFDAVLTYWDWTSFLTLSFASGDLFESGCLSSTSSGLQ